MSDWTTCLSMGIESAARLTAMKADGKAGLVTWKRIRQEWKLFSFARNYGATGMGSVSFVRRNGGV